MSHFTYEGETYFLFPAFESHDSLYPRWTHLLKEPGGIERRNLQPFFVEKLTLRGPNGNYELMAVRTTALADDKQAFINSFQTVRRKMMTFRQLLRKAVQTAAREH